MSNMQAAAAAFNEGRLDEAELLCRAIMAASPRHAEASLLLTALLLRRDSFAEAEALTAQAMEENADPPDALITEYEYDAEGNLVYRLEIFPRRGDAQG